MFEKFLLLSSIKEVVKKEKGIRDLLAIVVPFAIFLGIFFLMIILLILRIDVIFILLVPAVYPLIHFLKYEKEFTKFKKTKPSKNIVKKTKPEKYFEIHSPTKAVIRYNMFEKLFKYYLIGLIVIALLVSIGFNSMFLSLEDAKKDFDEKVIQHQNEFTKIVGMDENTLRIYFKEKIILIPDNQKRQHLKDIFEKEDIEKWTLSGDLEMLEHSEDFAWNKVNELNSNEIQMQLLEKTDTMSYDELKQHSTKYVESIKPYGLFPKNLDNTLSIFLISIVLIPVTMFYTISLSKFSLTRSPDFHFLLSKACFVIVNDEKSLNKFEKISYFHEGITIFNKFVKKTVGMNLRKLEHILSYFLTKNPTELTENAYYILEFFNSKNPLRVIEFLKLRIPHEYNLPILIKESLSEKVRGWIPFLVPTLTALVSVLSVLFAKSLP